MSKGQHKVFFENLEGLRFFAFLVVFINHTFLHYYQQIDFLGNNKFFALFIELIGSGEKAVSFFFVLSGFLITYLILNEQKTTGKFKLKKFYGRRFLRIWPLYYLTVLFGFVIYPQIKEVFFQISTIQPHSWWHHLLFLSNFDLVELYNQNVGKGTDILMLVINWSLSVEEQFYLVWPLIFLIIPTKHYLKVFITIAGLSVLYRIYIFVDYIALMYDTFAVMSDLAIGGIIAYLAFFKKGFTNFFKTLPKAVIIGAYLLIIYYLAYDYGIFNFSAKYTIYKRILWAACFAFIILEQNYSEQSLLKMNQLKFASRWGKYSYGLYLLHPIAIQITIVTQKLTGFYPNQIYQHILFTILSFILTLLLAYLSYSFFESYFLHLKEKYFSIKKT